MKNLFVLFSVGNAGVFSNAGDLAILAAMLLNNGELNGKRIMSPLTVKAMSSVPKGFEEFGRTLGWDSLSDRGDKSMPCELFGSSVYGHTGFTGTMLVIVPETQTAIILLTNRVHLKTGNVERMRRLVVNAVAGAIVGSEY